MKKNTIRYYLLSLLLTIPIGKVSAQSALFPMSSVRLLPSRFQDNFKRDSAWMMSIPVPSLLHSFFYDAAKIGPLKQSNDDLGSNHANTFIPKLIGEARRYELQGRSPVATRTGNDSSRQAASLLFNTLAFKHAFVTGEVSDKEHLFDAQKQSKHLTGYDGENCCTFNSMGTTATAIFSSIFLSPRALRGKGQR